MTSTTVKVLALTGLFAGAMAVAAQAAPVVFTAYDANGNPSVALAATPNSDAARNSFFSNLQGVGTETFETIPAGSTAPLAINFGSAGTATLLGGGNVNSVIPGTTNGFGRYSVPSLTSSNYWETTAGSGGNFNIAFTSAIAAFGFYGIDIGDFSGTLTLVLTDTLGNLSNLDVPAAPIGSADGSVLYFGFYDLATQYTNIAFSTTTGSGDVFAFDNFSIGTLENVVPAPEPVSMALLGTGLLGLGLIRRRRG